MPATRTGFFQSRVAFAAVIGFLVLFSAVAAGYDYNSAGRAKWGNPAWTGEKAGAVIAGFINGANAKAVKSPQNPNPEVLPAQRDLNGFYLQHTKLFSWLVVLGELLMPLGILALLVVTFPTARFFLMGIAGLAAFVNLTFLAEGTSSSNPPMVFMWLTVIWVAGLFPAGALFYAIDVRRLLGRAVDAQPVAMAISVGQWLFAAAMLIVTFIAAILIYPLGEAVILLVVTAAIAAALAGINALLVQRTARAGQEPARAGTTLTV